MREGGYADFRLITSQTNTQLDNNLINPIIIPTPFYIKVVAAHLCW